MLFRSHPDRHREWVRPVPLLNVALILCWGDGLGPVTKCLASAALERSCCLQSIIFFALSQVKTWLRVFLWREGLTLTYKAKYIEKFCEIHSQINLFVAVEPRNHNHKPEKEKGYHLLRDFLPQSMMRHCQF